MKIFFSYSNKNLSKNLNFNKLSIKHFGKPDFVFDSDIKKRLKEKYEMNKSGAGNLQASRFDQVRFDVMK